jgi:hypothetical protein
MLKVQKLIEIAKCKQDFVYAIENYLETEDRTQGGYVKFKLFPKQKELINAYINHHHNIVMKPRQAGISTTTAAYIAILVALALKEKPEKILIAANKQETAKEFLKKIKDFVSQLPDWMDIYRPAGSNDWFDKEKNASSHIKLNNGCEIKAVASSKDALRGYTPSYIIIDEAAFIEGHKGEEFYSAAQPSLATGGRSIIVSTPNGNDPLYYKTYKMAEEGANNYNIIKMKWYEDPRYNKGLKWQKKNDKDEVIKEVEEWDKDKWDELITNNFHPTSGWFENMCAQLNHDKRKIAQELLCSFLGSGDNVIDPKYVERHRKHNMQDPIRKEWMDGNMWIWEDPIKGHKYIMALDASSGSADDFSTVQIIDFTTGHQVAEYRGKVAPDGLGEIAHYYGDLYTAFVVVDITGGWGANTVLKLIDLAYPTKRMYYDTVIGIDSVQNNRQIQKHIRNGKLPGLNFQKNRNTIVSEMEKVIRMDTFKIRSIRTLNEMDSFVYINGRPDHTKGTHDDCLMGIGMCAYVAMTSFKDLEKSNNTTKVMIDSYVTTNTLIEEANSELSNVINMDSYVDTGRLKKTVQVIDQENMWVFSGMMGFKKKR